MYYTVKTGHKRRKHWITCINFENLWNFTVKFQILLLCSKNMPNKLPGWPWATMDDIFNPADVIWKLLYLRHSLMESSFPFNLLHAFPTKGNVSSSFYEMTTIFTRVCIEVHVVTLQTFKTIKEFNCFC